MIRLLQGDCRDVLPTLAGESVHCYEVRTRRLDTTTGWSLSCGHTDAGVVPCVVLDPFSGAGTTLLVADRLQRDGIGIELNPAYGEMAQTRLVGDAPLLVDLAAD